MAAVFEKTFIQDLTGRLIVRYCPEIVFSKDNLSNQINVKLYVGPNEYAGGGTVTATVIRSDGNTVPVSGSISGNVVSVTLIEACMEVPGQIQVFIRLTSGNVKTTIFAGVFTAIRTETGTIIDPGTIIPSITDLINQIQAAIDSIPADYSTLLASVAGTYNASKTYAVGDYVWYNGQLYRCSTAITTAESWTAAHWTSAVVGDDLASLKSALNTKFNTIKITSVGRQNIYVNAGDTLIIDVHSNTVSTNLYVFPYAAGDTILNISANVTNQQYTFVAGKEGYIQLQNTSTVIDADVTYQSALSQGVDILSNDVNALSLDIGIKNIANIEAGHYLIATRIGQTVSVSNATQNWAYTPSPTLVKSGSKVIVSTRGASMCALAISNDDDISNAVAAVIANNDSVITDYEYTPSQDVYVWVSGRVNETTAKIYYDNDYSVYKMAEEALAKATSSDEELNGIEFKTPNTSRNLYLHTGDKIIIDVSSNTIASNFMIFPYAAGDPFIQIPVGASKTIFTAYKDGYINLQSTGTVIDAMIYISRFDFKIDELEKLISEGTKSYTVKKDGTGDFSSFTAALRALENDETKKILYVYSGVYDIYEELGGDDFIATIDPTTTNWRDVQPVVPPNTSVIGLGNVELRFAPTADQIGSTQMAFLFSPLNISGNCHIENLSVYGTNCRYAIHDESSGMSKYDDTVHTYKNVRARKDHGTYGNAQVFASGLGARCRWTFESCEFSSDMSGMWSVHTTTSVASDSASIIFNNCVFIVDNNENASNIMQFITGSSGHAALENFVAINNCYVGGSVLLTTDYANQVTNKFNVRSVGSTIKGGISVSDNFTSNPYPPKVYQ